VNIGVVVVDVVGYENDHYIYIYIYIYNKHEKSPYPRNQN